MRHCTRCEAWPTHLVVVDDSGDTAAVPYCSHHALQVGIEALVEGRDLKVTDMTRFMMNTPIAAPEAAPYED